MSALRERVIEEHINKYYPNARILNYNDPDSDLVFTARRNCRTSTTTGSLSAVI